MAIVGHAETSRDLAPYWDQLTEIWTMNDVDGWIAGRRVTRRFELHDAAHRDAHRRDDYPERLTEHALEAPLYMRSPLGVGAREFPFSHLLRKYGPHFGSSVAWMLAFAHDQGFRWIGLYGVEMGHFTEWYDQRETLFWWLGYLEAKGVEVYLPEGCSLRRESAYALV